MSPSRKSLSRAALVLLLGMLIGVGCAVPQDSVAETVTWETDFCFIKFEWNGTWDDVAYWAYGMYLLDIPDWAYLFGVYGMGWEHIWGSGFWGSNGTWGPEDKVVVTIRSDFRGSLYSYSYTEQLGQVILGIQGVSPDLINGGWVNTMCTVGREVAFNMTHVLGAAYIGDSPENTENHSTLWLAVDFLAKHVGNVLWPWGDHTMYMGYDVSTLDGILAGYRATITDSWSDINQWEHHSYWWWESVYGSQDVQQFKGFVIGYLISDYDHLFLSAADGGGAGSIYRNATWLAWLRDNPTLGHHARLDGAFMAAYGHEAFSDTLDERGDQFWYHKAIDPAYNQMEAWYYHLIFGEWYTYHWAG